MDIQTKSNACKPDVSYEERESEVETGIYRSIPWRSSQTSNFCHRSVSIADSASCMKPLAKRRPTQSSAGGLTRSIRINIFPDGNRQCGSPPAFDFSKRTRIKEEYLSWVRSDPYLHQINGGFSSGPGLLFLNCTPFSPIRASVAIRPSSTRLQKKTVLITSASSGKDSSYTSSWRC